LKREAECRADVCEENTAFFSVWGINMWNPFPAELEMDLFKLKLMHFLSGISDVVMNDLVLVIEFDGNFIVSLSLLMYVLFCVFCAVNAVAMIHGINMSL